MNGNPYEPPRVNRASSSENASSNPLVANRAVAAIRYTQTVLILAVPAIANLLLFNHFVTGGVASRRLFLILATLNAIGVALGIFGLLFGGFFVLEKFTYLANRIFGRSHKLDQWKTALYDVLGQAWFLAIPTAVLWAIWLGMFYLTNAPYFSYGVPSLVLAHLIAASLYGRLFWRWYKTATDK